MQILSVQQARVVALLPLEELGPLTNLDLIGLTKALVERYGFIGYPQRPEDFSGKAQLIEYETGKLNEIGIAKLQIYGGGFVVDTLTSTDDSEKVLDDLLNWAKETYGFKYEPGMIFRKGYISQVVFRSERPLTALNPKLAAFGERLTKSVAKTFKDTFVYEPIHIEFGFDTTNLKSNAGNFVVARRVETPFAENKYFSSAPLPTIEHLQLLEEFEAALQF
jgi:hypothetical protein